MTFPFPHFQPPAPAAGGAWGGPSSGLTHRWPMDAANVSGYGVSQTVADVVGSSTGTMATAGFSSVAGPQGTDTALGFNGSAYFTVASQPMPAAPFSLFTWAKLNTHNQNSSPYIISFCSSSSANYFISADGSKLLVCAGSASTSSKCVASSTTPFSNTNWHHVGFTYDGSTVTMYVDGSSVGTAADTGWASTTNDWRFGNQKNGGDYLNGALKQAVVYNRALSAAEVSQLYAAY